MLDQVALKDLLHKQELSRKDKLLLLLAADGAKPKSVSAVKELGIACGLRRVKQWNVSDVLGKGEPQAIRGSEGWELSSIGKARVATLAGVSYAPPTAKAAVNLRACLAAIKDADTLNFLDEAVTCLETGLLRAAVVLSWVGAISLLYRHIVATSLTGFNTEAARRDPKWKLAKTEDDLALMKEHEFLNVLEGISVIGKSVKQELQSSLTLRNACGHPNSYKLGPARVAAHVEALILNVFQKF
jgi:hypothetical protein